MTAKLRVKTGPSVATASYIIKINLLISKQPPEAHAKTE